MILEVKALSDKIGREIPLPYYATDGAAAVDLHACIDEPLTIPAEEDRWWCPRGWRWPSRRAMWALWRCAPAWASAGHHPL